MQFKTFYNYNVTNTWPERCKHTQHCRVVVQTKHVFVAVTNTSHRPTNIG